MATKAQTKANRQNAEKSTGPKTAKGKRSVSQNAVKHGLFAHEITIHGEDKREFYLFRETFLADLRPAGVMESMLVERIISLSWRLRRAERMESQVIDHLIICTGGERPDTFTLLQIPLEERKVMVKDGGVLMRDLTLGQAIVKDFTHYQVLDRLMLYERRMENSMHKTIRELRTLQGARKAEQARAAEQQSPQETPPAARRRSNLKKQSQFAAAEMNANAVAKEGYEDGVPQGPAANKANFAAPRASSVSSASSAAPGRSGKVPG